MTDFVLTDVAKSVARQKILENGYGYIVSGVDAVVAHPKVSETAKSSQTILQLEFLSGENPEEEAAYRTNILTPMRAGGTSSAVYQKRTLVHPPADAASSLRLSSPRSLAFLPCCRGRDLVHRLQLCPLGSVLCGPDSARG